MSLVYIVSAYRLPNQLIRLVARLQAPDVTFLIHVDKKSGPDVWEPVTRALGSRPDVHLLDRHVCHWGGFGHVAASLKAIAEIHDRRIPCDHAILLTGQDFPIASNAEIADTLERHRGQSFLEHFRVPNHETWAPDGGMFRINRWHHWVLGRRLQLPTDGRYRRAAPLFRAVDALLPRERPFLPGVQPYGGSSYWCLSREAVSLVHRHVRDHPEFMSFFRHVYIPDEMFFQTILLNSALREEVVNDDLRYIDWSANGSSPAVLTAAHFPELRISGKLFARKFDETVDADVLDMIEESLL